MEDFKIENGCLVSYSGRDAKIVVPDGVCEIGKEAFAEQKNIKEVVLPATVKKIGEKAFYRCPNLKTINLQNISEEIALKAFCLCESLCEVTLSKELKILEDAALAQTGLEAIYIPGSVKKIGWSAFAFCPNLQTIQIGEGCEEIGVEAFKTDEPIRRAFWIPASVRTFGANAFYNESYSRKGQNYFYGPKNNNIFDEISEEEFKTDESNFLIVIPTMEEKMQRLGDWELQEAKLKKAINNINNQIQENVKEIETIQKDNFEILHRSRLMRILRGEKETYETIKAAIWKCEGRIGNLRSDLAKKEKEVAPYKKKVALLRDMIQNGESGKLVKDYIAEIEKLLLKKKDSSLTEDMYKEVYPLIDMLYKIGHTQATLYHAVVLLCEASVYFFSKKEENKKKAYNELGYYGPLVTRFEQKLVGTSLYVEQMQKANEPKTEWFIMPGVDGSDL